MAELLNHPILVVLLVLLTCGVSFCMGFLTATVLFWKRVQEEEERERLPTGAHGAYEGRERIAPEDYELGN